MDAPLILVVAHDPDLGTALVATLTAAGYRVEWQRDALEGLVAVEHLQPTLIMLDWALPFVRGATFLEVLRVGLAYPPPPVIVVTGGDPTEPVTVGATAVLAPTADPATVVHAVRSLHTPV